MITRLRVKRAEAIKPTHLSQKTHDRVAGSGGCDPAESIETEKDEIIIMNKGWA
jgi:hypothetical protein